MHIFTGEYPHVIENNVGCRCKICEGVSLDPRKDKM